VPAALEPALYHYLRTNRDGSEPEHIVQFFPNPRHVAVYKWVSKCHGAAYVTAELDPAGGEATALYAGKVAQDGTQARFGRIALDPAARALDLWIDSPDGRKTERVEGLGRPWALFDYDLADLNAAFQARPPRGDFAFWWALVWPDPATGKMVRKLGWVDARHAGIVAREGRAVRQFDLTLRADPKVTGHFWLDPDRGHIVAADFDRPNHDNYTDFALELERVEAGGQRAWDRLLEAHYGECPTGG
jgi:hypothetical protein